MIKAIFFDFFGVLEMGGKSNSDLLDFIKNDLKPSYKLGMISNSSSEHFSQLLNESQQKLFNGTVFSGQESVAKPDPQIFELAAQRLGVRPAECIFVDDSSVHLDGAEQAGMHSILYRGFEQFKEDLERLLPPGTDN